MPAQVDRNTAERQHHQGKRQQLIPILFQHCALVKTNQRRRRQLRDVDTEALQLAVVKDGQHLPLETHGNIPRRLALQNPHRNTRSLCRVLAVVIHNTAEHAVADAVLPQVKNRRVGIGLDQRQAIAERLAAVFPVDKSRQHQNAVALTELTQARRKLIPAQFRKLMHDESRLRKLGLKRHRLLQISPTAGSTVGDDVQTLALRQHLLGKLNGFAHRRKLDQPGVHRVGVHRATGLQIVQTQKHHRPPRQQPLALLQHEVQGVVIRRHHQIVGRQLFQLVLETAIEIQPTGLVEDSLAVHVLEIHRTLLSWQHRQHALLDQVRGGEIRVIRKDQQHALMRAGLRHGQSRPKAQQGARKQQM